MNIKLCCRKYLLDFSLPMNLDMIKWNMVRLMWAYTKEENNMSYIGYIVLYGNLHNNALSFFGH